MSYRENEIVDALSVAETTIAEMDQELLKAHREIRRIKNDNRRMSIELSNSKLNLVQSMAMVAVFPIAIVAAFVTFVTSILALAIGNAIIIATLVAVIYVQRKAYHELVHRCRKLL